MAVVISGDGPITGVSSVKSTAANTAVVLGDSGSNTNTCRAWVNFNGTGVVAIRASFNVSSITDNGTGDFTVNFPAAMPDINYAVVITGGKSGSTFYQTTEAAAAPTITAYRFNTFNTSDAVVDSPVNSVAIFR